MQMAGPKPYGQFHFREVNGNRMAYVDEGDGDAIVFAHGNPTSSYLWRNVMPHLEGLGRLVAADMIGMGESDKLHPSGPDRYNYDEQRDYLFALWDALDLGDNVTLVLHDWGSVLGFDWANQHRDRIQGIAFMKASVTPISWSEFPLISAVCLKAFDRRRARPWCWSRTVSSSKFCPQECSASSATKRWTTTGGRSPNR
jgi:haloalkane dehalogenase